MNNIFTIGEIAQLLNVPTPTLRFWEEKGLFSVAKDSNRYRKYTLSDLVQIADIIFYRNIGIPIKEVLYLQRCTLPQYEQALLDVKTQLAAKAEEYQRMYQHTLRQQLRLKELLTLMDREFFQEDIPFHAVAAFDFREKEKLIQYSSDPTSYVRYFDTQDMSTEARGIILPLEQARSSLLWQKEEGQTFLTFLIREKTEHGYASDVNKKLAQVPKGYRTGVMLAQYLLTAFEDGERIDYLKAYVAVEPIEPHLSDKP